MTPRSPGDQESLLPDLIPDTAVSEPRDAGGSRGGVRKKTSAAREPAASRPVARVVVDVALAHLDRPFDYLVPARDNETAQIGSRVRVRFAGRLVDGLILDRVDRSNHDGRLAMIHRVVSGEQVLTPAVARLCRQVADRYAGTLADVVRLAVPPRHGRAEAESHAPVVTTDAPAALPGDDALAWQRYRAGGAFLSAVSAGTAARAVWQALPGEDWPARLAEAARAAWQAGRGALLVVADARDLARVDAALSRVLPAASHVALSAGVGPAERYRRFLRLSRGEVRVAVGTRSAVFAPVANLGLVAIFDDGDDSFAEPRAPYPHAREVSMVRSVSERTALLIGGFARTAEAQLLLRSGWASAVIADRPTVRASSPRIEAADDPLSVRSDLAAAGARIGPAAFAAARAALADDAPVLVQVPRRGYVPGFGCGECGEPARCRQCCGPLALASASGAPQCRWCGVSQPGYRCPACGSGHIRAWVAGAMRTAEEFGRAFAGVPVVTSAGEAIRDAIDTGAAVVLATPGAEPVADGGYGAALLLDGSLLLGRPSLRASEETLRRWMTAAALVRPARDGGRVVVGAAVSIPTVQALIRWDPAGHAGQELAARGELSFPPVAAMASVSGEEAAVALAVRELDLPETGEVLGPVAVEGQTTRQGAAQLYRALVRVRPAQRKELARALTVLLAARSARKEDASVRVQVDPIELV